MRHEAFRFTMAVTIPHLRLRMSRRCVVGAAMRSSPCAAGARVACRVHSKTNACSHYAARLSADQPGQRRSVRRYVMARWLLLSDVGQVSDLRLIVGFECLDQCLLRLV